MTELYGQRGISLRATRSGACARAIRAAYTRGLMKSIAQLDCDRSQALHVIAGMVPSLHQIPEGCRFAPRCPYADELCRTKMPPLEAHRPNHNARCWHIEKIAQEGGLKNA